MATKNLTHNERQAVEICAKIQHLCKSLGVNLQWDIKQNSEDLVALYKLRRVYDYLAGILPQHEVIDSNGKILGTLYDNGYIEGVMMATGIKLDSAIDHTENHLRKISIKQYLL